MRTRRPNWSLCRAVIAVAALYALALQALFGGLIGLRMLDPAHILCLQESGTGQDETGKAPPLHHHLACCTAAHAAPALDVPVLASAAIAWPFRTIARTAWRPEIVAAPRAPPGISAGARAPPVA